MPPLFKHSTIQSRQEQCRNVLLFVDLASAVLKHEVLKVDKQKKNENFLKDLWNTDKSNLYYICKL